MYELERFWKPKYPNRVFFHISDLLFIDKAYSYLL